MPKIIIPNGFELYALTDSKNDRDTRINFSQRFLWCLQNGDIIILPKRPCRKKLNYIFKLKKLFSKRILILSFSQHSNLTFQHNLLHPFIIQKTKEFMRTAKYWELCVCYFHETILTFADRINLPIKQSRRLLSKNDFCKWMNAKSNFRKIAKELSISIPAGANCLSEQQLLNAFTTSIDQTKQFILKQDFHSSAQGNIGISFLPDKKFTGAHKTIITKTVNLSILVHELWQSYAANQSIVLETFYENNGTYTVGFEVTNTAIYITHLAKIRMQETWLGIEMGISLSASLQAILLKDAYRMAAYLQKNGYEGLACMDAIITTTNQILFTEINLRAGAEMNIISISKHLHLGNKRFIKSLRNISSPPFPFLINHLRKSKLLFDNKVKQGVIILSFNENTQLAEFLIVANNPTNAENMEQSLLKLMQN